MIKPKCSLLSANKKRIEYDKIFAIDLEIDKKLQQKGVEWTRQNIKWQKQNIL